MQSDRQQFKNLNMCRDTLDLFISFCLEWKFADDREYSDILDWKGSVFSRQKRIHEFRAIARKSGDPKVERLFQDLDDTSRNLANLALHVPKPERKVAWEGQIAELTQKKEEIEEELSRRSDEFRKLMNRGEITAEQIRAVLPADAALVDFLEYTHYVPSKDRKGWFDQSKHFMAFVIRPNHPTAMIDLGLSKPIDDAVKSWRERIFVRRNPVDGRDDPALVLRDKVWLPLAKHLEGAKTILLSPDGSLNQIPFDALPGDDTNKYLIEERAFAVIAVPEELPNLLAKTKENRGANDEEGFKRSLLLVGDVDYGADPGVSLAANPPAAPKVRSGLIGDFESLEHTRGEILAIKDSFEERFDLGAVVRKKEKATEAEVRKEAPKHRYIHIATHGFFASDDPREKSFAIRSALRPMTDSSRSGSGSDLASIDPFGGAGIIGYHPGLLSGLVLAGANRPRQAGQDDGILTALEVAGLDLSNAELVVLSACETGLGESAGGEGLLGLQRAFQVSGARSVVASYWIVRDLETSSLMQHFYMLLWDRKNPMSRLEALRESRLWMLREGKVRGMELLDKDVKGRTPPYYWAGFVLSGDWR